MKKSRLSYDEWKCIVSKESRGKRIHSELVKGYVGLIDIKEVKEPQIWRFNGADTVVCAKGIKWLTILPQNDWYCITAMINEQKEIVLWYIDMIAGQGIDVDNVPYFDDLYLDLIVYPDGTIIVDDMDELEEALVKGYITQEQFSLAIETSNRVRETILSDISSFTKYTKKCYEIMGTGRCKESLDA